MTHPVEIEGLTWDHPRAYEGLDAETACFNVGQDRIRLRWERHSLCGFEETPIVETAARYDLIILDHPFIGDAAEAACLVDLDGEPALKGLLASNRFVGPSLESYRDRDGLWAMPIDAAYQAAAWRPDLMDRPPATLGELRALARQSEIVLAMACPHAFMNFLCIAGIAGADISGGDETLLPRDVALYALDLLRELSASLPRAAFGWSSIGALDALAASERLAYCPMVFCFNTYARDARAGATLRFAVPPIARGGIPAARSPAARASPSPQPPRIATRQWKSSHSSPRRSRNCAAHRPGSAGADRGLDGRDGRPGQWRLLLRLPSGDVRRGAQAALCRIHGIAEPGRGHHARSWIDRSVEASAVLDRIDGIYRHTRQEGRVYKR